MKEPVNLKYNCQEDLQSMSCTDKGKFCSSCQKEVIDFTKMSYSEIQHLKGSQTEMCGMFLPEQIDPSLHSIELPKVRSLAFLSTILVSLNFGNVSAQSTVDPKMEQAQGMSNAPNLTPEETKLKMKSGQHISMSKADVQITENPAKSKVSLAKRERKVRRRKRNAHKKLFWSKKFPFVHRRANYKGRF